MKLLEKLKFSAEYYTKPHGREIKKPNEDRVLVDEKNGVFILLDGVTRVHEEYESAPYKSAAGDLGDIVIDEAYRFIIDNIDESDTERILRGAVLAANVKIREYREKKSEAEWIYYPSTLGIIGLIRDNTLHFAYAGDCLALLIRRGAKMLMGREWTLEAVDKLALSKAQRYDRYCNHPDNHLSYTVFNGDDEVTVGLEYSFIDLHSGDTLLIGSDGIGDYMKFEKSEDLLRQSPEEMINNSAEYDALPYAEYADDKTLIKLSF